ncbi:MAG TPA: hypothetical protein VG124_04030 [Beijerinckiaceae bacterium]|jgi:hypothetical protein|nr:hypothetical protein [Beijerinckiaceae bacterium]
MLLDLSAEAVDASLEFDRRSEEAATALRPSMTAARGTKLRASALVPFDVLDVESGTASGVFGRDASVFVASRVCIMHAR